ncbi:MAG: XF1762 family protein [Planctomycetota bacterium]
MIEVCPVSLKLAKEVCGRLHRHLGPPTKCNFAVGICDESGEVRGVAIVGEPVARNLCDGWTFEVLRVATDGCENGCSMLLAACRKMARAWGARRLVTYTLPSEGGTSLRAAGFVYDGQTKGGTWQREGRTSGPPVCGEPKSRWIWE